MKTITISILILFIGVVSGAVLFKQTKPTFLKLILIGLILSFILPFLDIPILSTFAFYLFAILSLIFTIYSFKKRKWLGAIIGWFVFLTFLQKAFHFPFANTMRFLMLIPILCFILALKKPKRYNAEFSILLMFVAYELGEFVMLFDL